MEKQGDNKNTALYVLTRPKFTFKDIVLNGEIRDAINEVLALNKFQDLIFEKWGLGTVSLQNRSTSVILYGESGTGKTMVAHAIAHELNSSLLIVKYSEVESKYPGQTSKNLVTIFTTAEKNGAVLLFDEADALLSKRITSMSNACDVNVNQTRNVLLKLLDEYSGIILFTTNFIQNIDSAFFRRITTHIKFPLPTKEIRLKIWQHYLVPKLPLAGLKVEMAEKLSDISDLSGADISMCVLKAALHTAVNNETLLTLGELQREANILKEAKQEFCQPKIQTMVQERLEMAK
jgi:SpoVK/Ycf46/Vps4 family AAA+-type ATPase